VDVHPVKTGAQRAACAAGEGFDHLSDLHCGGGLHHAARERIGHGRGRERAVLGHPGLASGVRQLREHLAAVTVHRRREAGQARHHRVVVDTGLPRRVAPSGVAEHMTAQDQTDPVAR